MKPFKCRHGDPRCEEDPCPAGIRWLCETRDSDASLAEDPKGLSREAVAARAEGIAR